MVEKVTMRMLLDLAMFDWLLAVLACSVFICTLDVKPPSFRL